MGYPIPSRPSGKSFSQMLERSFRHWAARQQPGPGASEPADGSRPLTIALSREAGTQGTAVGEAVGKLLGWHVYDSELLEHIAKEMGLRTSLLESVDEKHRSWIVEALQGFMSPPKKGERNWLVSENNYAHHLVQTVLSLASHGRCVIVGRGAALILPPETTLRVCLVGALRDRVAAFSRLQGISEQEAAGKARTIDRERADFVRNHFQKDPDDPRNYDLVLNALRLSVEHCAEMIVEMLPRLEARAGGDSP